MSLNTEHTPQPHAGQASKVRPRWRDFSKLVSSQCFTPAVRTVIVEAWADVETGETGCEIIPVLTLMARVVDAYCQHERTDRKQPATSPDHRELLSQGWHFEDRREEFDCLIIGEFGLQSASELLEASNVSWRLVACPWAASQDRKRLAATIAEVKEEALRKAKCDAAHRARKAVGQ